MAPADLEPGGETVDALTGATSAPPHAAVAPLSTENGSALSSSIDRPRFSFAVFFRAALASPCPEHPGLTNGEAIILRRLYAEVERRGLTVSEIGQATGASGSR